jgi:hypothetical protein
MSGSFSPANFAAPGAGTSTLNLTPSLATPPGKYTIGVVASGAGLLKTIPLVVNVTAAPNFTLTANASATAIQVGQVGGNLTLTVKNLTGNFNAPITFTIGGMPAGVTAVFSSPTLAAPGTGTNTLTMTALSTAMPGQYRININGSGGTVTETVNVLLTVLAVPGFTLKTDVSSLALTAGATFSTTVSVVPQSGFNSPVTLTLGALPVGVTAALSSNTLSGANATAILTIQTASSLTKISYAITLAGTSPVIATALPSQTATMQLAIGGVQTNLSLAFITVNSGASGSLLISDVATNFAGSVTFSASNIPNGVSYSFAPSSLTGSGSTQLTFAVGPSAKPGTTTVNVRTAAGGTVSLTPLQLIIQ